MLDKTLEVNSMMKETSESDLSFPEVSEGLRLVGLSTDRLLGLDTQISWSLHKVSRSLYIQVTRSRYS